MIFLKKEPRGDKVSPYGADEVPIDKNDRAVFDVGIAKLRLNQKLCADLVTLSEAGAE